MANGPREKAYDDLIAPLMTQIIGHCQSHDIPVVATFQLDDDGGADGPMFCTTIIVREGDHQAMHAAAAATRPGSQIVAMFRASMGDA